MLVAYGLTRGDGTIAAHMRHSVCAGHENVMVLRYVTWGYWDDLIDTISSKVFG